MKSLQKSKLCILLGGPRERMKSRLSHALSHCSEDEYDFLFTGFNSEWKWVRQHLGSDLPKMSYVYSYNTWSNIKHAQPIWQSYDEIFVATEKWHGKRVQTFFQWLGLPMSKLILHNTGSREKKNAPLLYLLYSCKITSYLLNIVSKYTTRDHLEWPLPSRKNSLSISQGAFIFYQNQPESLTIPWYFA